MSALERVAAFRLLPAPAALEAFRGLPSDGRLLLLGAREPGVLAPLLEGLEPAQRACFGPAPEGLYERMLEEAL